MILIHPPVAKPGEPPAGIARLSGALSAHNFIHTVLDANLEGLLYLLQSPRPESAEDVWSKRAYRNAGRNLSLIRDPDTYRSLARYTRVVTDLGRVLEKSSGRSGAHVGLANFQHELLSPLRSRDLIAVAEQPELNVFYPYFSRRLESIIHHEQTQVIGFSMNYLSQAINTFAMIGFVRKKFPGLKIIVGGGLSTSWLRTPLWQNPFTGLVDHFVAGPGEMRLFEILGIEPKEMISLPDYQTMPLHDYFSPGFILPYSAAAGCFWNRCNFCPEKAEGNPYIPIPHDRVIADLEILAVQTAPVLIHLLDNAVAPALMGALIEKGPHLPWYGFARVSSHLADPDFCMALKQSGCIMLKLGLESGDQQVLDRMEKGIMVDMASRVMKNLKRAGIASYVYLIFGTPAENLHSARMTLEFVSKHRQYIDFLNLAIFNMPACGAGSSDFETKRFYDGDLSLYTDFLHPHGWDRKQVRHFLEDEFRKNPAVSLILKNDPTVFTSNHAPLFVKARS